MSRTIKGSKGYKEFWSKRPGKWFFAGSGPYAKHLTHRAERREGKDQVKKDLQDELG